MARKLIPVQPNSAGVIQAPDHIKAVFDTNGHGELLEVSWSCPRVGSECTAHLKHLPFGQVYVLIGTE